MTRLALIAALTVSTLLACRVDDGPQDSSGSHWLSCVEDSDCTPYDSDGVCSEGYCVDASGVRLEGVSSPTIDATATDGSVGIPASGSGGGPGGGGGSADGPGGGGRSGGGPGGGGGSADGPGGGGNASDDLGDGGTCEELPAGLSVANVFEGDYAITGQSSVDAAALFSEISGTLSVSPRSADDLDVIELPGLERVGGSIDTSGSTVTRLALPRLETVSGDLLLNANAGLVAADFRSLRSVGGALSVTGSSQLASLNLATLTSVAGDVTFGSSALANCEVQFVLDNLGTGSLYTDGRDDCSCTLVCSSIVPSCP